MFTVRAMITVLNRKLSRPCTAAKRRNLARGDVHVRDLERHSEHQREIEKIEVVGRRLVRELQAAIDLCAPRRCRVILVRIAKAQAYVRHQP